MDAKTGKEVFKFKTPSGIIGNVMSYEHSGKQYVAVLSGVGGWAGIGLAAGLTNPTEGLGAVGGYAALSKYTSLGGTMTVFALPAHGVSLQRETVNTLMTQAGSPIGLLGLSAPGSHFGTSYRA